MKIIQQTKNQMVVKTPLCFIYKDSETDKIGIEFHNDKDVNYFELYGFLTHIVLSMKREMANMPFESDEDAEADIEDDEEI